jgi:hypothetical protein
MHLHGNSKDSLSSPLACYAALVLICKRGKTMDNMGGLKSFIKVVFRMIRKEIFKVLLTVFSMLYS